MSINIPTQTQSALDEFPPELQKALLSLRSLILETASENASIGPLEETLKWGEPAYLTTATKSGTTVRINRHKKSDTQYAFYVNCRTDLVERYKELYDDVLNFDGSRAVVFNINAELPTDAVKHCIAMAFTYHLRT